MSRYFEISYPILKSSPLVKNCAHWKKKKKKKKKVGLSRNTTYFDPTYNWWPLIFQRIHHFDRGKEQHKPSMVNNALKHGHRDAISLNVYLNVTFESIQCIHAMSKSEKKAHNYPQAPYAKDREGNCLWHMGLEIIFRSCPTCQSTSTRYEGLKKASNVCAWLLILTP